MAYVVNCTATAVPSVSSWTADIGPNQQDDILLICVAWRVSGTITCGSGYTSVAAKQNTDAIDSQWFVKIVGAGGEATPIISTSGAAATGAFVVYTIRDADVSGTAANAVDSSGSTAGSVGATLTSHALTTTTNNCLVVHGAAWDSTNAIAEPADMNMLANVLQLSSGVTFAAASGAIPTFTFTGNTSTNTGRAWAVAIKNGSSGDLPIRLVDGRAYIHKLGGFGTAPTVTAPNNYSTTKIPTGTGIVTHSAASTVATGSPAPGLWAFTGTKLSISTNLGADAWVGAYLSCASTNLSGKVCWFPYGFTGTVDNTRVGANGLIVVLASSVGNWVAYQVLQQAKWTTNWGGTLVVVPGVTAAYASEGTVDLTAIVAVGYFHHRVAGATATIDTLHGLPLYVSATSKFVGGGADGNGSVATEALYLSGGGLNYTAGSLVYPGSVSFQGTGQLVNKGPVQYGDGSAVTYIKHQLQSYEIPGSLDAQWRCGTNAANVTIYASASDVMDFSSSVFVTESAQQFVIGASSSLSATYNFSNTTLQGWTVTDNAGLTWSGTAFKLGAKATFAGGADLTNCTIAPSLTVGDAAVAITANGSVLTSSTTDVTGTNATYHIELGTAVTAVTLASHTFTGSAATNKVHVLKTTGTVTITISGTTSLSAGEVTSAGATVVISAPALYQSVVINNLVVGSRVRIYDKTSSTQLANATATGGNIVFSGGGTTATWTDPNPAAASRAINLRIAYQSGTTAKNFVDQDIGTCGTISGSETVTYQAAQTADTSYNTSAIDGSTVTGISVVTGGGNLVKFTLGGPATFSCQTVYAYQVYWQFTATGIAQETAFISSPDAANFIVTSFQFENEVANTIVTINNGYIVDSVTLTPDPLISTTVGKGTVNIATPHAVLITTGSGPLTAGQQTSLANAETSSASAASYALEAKKLLRNKRVIDTTTGIETVYDDAGAVMYTRNVYVDKNAAVPYDGTAAPHRVERYA